MTQIKPFNKIEPIISFSLVFGGIILLFTQQDKLGNALFIIEHIKTIILFFIRFIFFFVGFFILTGNRIKSFKYSLYYLFAFSFIVSLITITMSLNYISFSSIHRSTISWIVIAIIDIIIYSILYKRLSKIYHDNP